ncbi:MAG: NAD(P)-dependent oxidoreductase [Planctomycetota bacterium]
MRILVTGAAGRVGSAVAIHLHDVGHEVVATDVGYRQGLPFKLHLVDLCDTSAIYPLVEGCDAVIQAGNHPYAGATRPVQKLLAENVAMNSNVFYAAVDVGVRRIVGISSVQATTGMHGTKSWHHDAHHCPWPYLPADGQLPHNPGNNTYALSKVLAEQTLEAITTEYDDLAAVAVRFPYVMPQKPGKRWQYNHAVKPGDRRMAEGLSYVSMADACTSLQAIIEKMTPGYRQLFVAQSLKVRGMSYAEMATRFYPQLEVTGPFDTPGGLIDLSAMQDHYGWSPAAPPLDVDFAEDDPVSDK